MFTVWKFTEHTMRKTSTCLYQRNKNPNQPDMIRVNRQTQSDRQYMLCVVSFHIKYMHAQVHHQFPPPPD